MNHDKEMDTRGLSCPPPILRAKKALSSQSEANGEFTFFMRRK